MGEVVLRTLTSSDPSLAHVVVSSAGTANWHVGRPMDPRARSALDRAGYTDEGSLAEFASGAYLDEQDLIVVMTREHRVDVQSRLRRNVPVRLIRSFIDDRYELDLADPYYGHDEDFNQCLETITQSCREVVQALRLGDESFAT